MLCVKGGSACALGMSYGALACLGGLPLPSEANSVGAEETDAADTADTALPTETKENSAQLTGADFPAADPSGLALLNKSLLPFDDHPFYKSVRPSTLHGATNPEVERRVTAERRGRAGGSAQNSSLGPSPAYKMYLSKVDLAAGKPDIVTGYCGHVAKPELVVTHGLKF